VGKTQLLIVQIAQNKKIYQHQTGCFEINVNILLLSFTAYDSFVLIYFKVLIVFTDR